MLEVTCEKENEVLVSRNQKKLGPTSATTYTNKKDQSHGDPERSIEIWTFHTVHLLPQHIVSEMFGLVEIQTDRLDSSDNVIGINVKVATVGIQGKTHHAISPPGLPDGLHLWLASLLLWRHVVHGTRRGGEGRYRGLGKGLGLERLLLRRELLRRRKLLLLELSLLLLQGIRAGIKEDIIDSPTRS